MRGINFLIIIACLLLQSCSTERDYNPSAHLTAQEQDEIMGKILRYMAKPPEGTTFEERFYKGYDDYYQEQKRIHRMDAYYVDDHTHYFLVSRVAPSLTEKRVAIGGQLIKDAKGNLYYYEEVFRTWKMEPDTLAKRGGFLFDKMVRGEDLSSYYSSRSGNTDYIEFPDDRTYFDVEKRMWRSR